MSTMRQWGISSGGVAVFCVTGTAMVPVRLKMTDRPCSPMLARWAWKASCRSGRTRPIVLAGLAQDEEPDLCGSETRRRGRLGQAEMAVMQKPIEESICQEV